MRRKIVKNQLKNKSITFMVIILLLILIPDFVYSQQMPMGIDGVVYGIDGITRAKNNVKISVEDLTNGFYIEGNLRKDGSYSVVVNGRAGDSIIIKAWTPYNNATSETISLAGVMHGYNLILDISTPNTAPKIVSNPVILVYENQEYYYKVLAEDEQGDQLIYSLINSPQNMSIDNTTGVITWQPHEQDVGMNEVIVMVSDGIATDTQEFEIEVMPVNNPPKIITMPITSATAQARYVYDINASDLDSLELNFSLVQSPLGMSIDTITGVISWIPTLEQIGTSQVIVRVSDGELYDEQQFEIIVNGFINANPIIYTLPPLSVNQSELYQYLVGATDTDGDNITYSFDKSPTAMSINNESGLVQWLPNNSNVGSNEIIIRAEDGVGGYAIQNYTLTVINANDPPVIISKPTLSGYVWYMYQYHVDAIDPDNDNIKYSLVEKPRFMYINENTGKIYWVPLNTGNYKVIVQASDGKSYARQEFSIKIELKGKGKAYAGLVTKKGNTRSLEVKNDKLDVLSINYANFDTKKLDEDYLRVSSNELKPEYISKEPSSFVYNYFTVENQQIDSSGSSGLIVSGKLNFRVDKGWLNNYSIEPDELKLFSYNQKKDAWQRLTTKVIDEKSGYFYYEAQIDGLGDFAAGFFGDKESLQKKMDEQFIIKNKHRPQLRKPYIIAGKVYLAGNSNETGQMEYIIKNMRTNQTVSGKIDNKLNAYTQVLSGEEGDNIEVKIGNEGYYERSFVKLTGDIIREDVNLNVTKAQLETFAFKNKLNKIVSIALLLVLTAVPLAGLVLFVLKKGNNGKGIKKE